MKLRKINKQNQKNKSFSFYNISKDAFCFPFYLFSVGSLFTSLNIAHHAQVGAGPNRILNCPESMAGEVALDQGRILD